MARRIPNSNIAPPSHTFKPRRKKYGEATPNIPVTPQKSKPSHKPSKKQPVQSPVPIKPLPVIPSLSVTIDSILAGKLSIETKRAYRSDLKHFLKYLGHPKALKNPDELITILCNVNRTTAAEYRDHMLQIENKAAATVNRHLATINTVYNALTEEGGGRHVIPESFFMGEEAKGRKCGENPGVYPRAS